MKSGCMLWKSCANLSVQIWFFVKRPIEFPCPKAGLTVRVSKPSISRALKSHTPSPKIPFFGNTLKIANDIFSDGLRDLSGIVCGAGYITDKDG